MKLKDKVAIVTGASQGIGCAIALSLAKEGSHIILGYHQNRDLAIQMATEIQDMGRKTHVCKVDVRSSKEIDSMITESIKKFGKLDILVNNAGVSSMTRVIDMEEEDWDYNMDVNAKGVFLCTKAVLRQMIAQGEGGKIINISSLAGKMGNKFYSHYSASKFAVIGFTKSVALEVAEYGITVNAVCPGHTQTLMTEREAEWESKYYKLPKEDILETYRSVIPLGRFGTPDDVAHVVVFLASKDSDFITGAAIDVAGGSHIGE